MDAMDADGVTCIGASREHSDALAAPRTYVHGLKVSKHLQKREIVTGKKGQPSAGSCKMHWESIEGDGDCAWAYIVTALVKEKRSDLDDTDRELMRDRVAKPWT